MEISVIGLNHRTAPVDVREQFALPAELTVKLLQTIRAEKIFSEALILDTCNRTEIYFAGKDQPDPLPHILAHIARLKGVSPLTDTSVFYRHRGLHVIRHIFRVAASLDSQIVGEHQILGQLKDAYRLALEAGTSRFLLNKLLHRAFRVGKQVQTDTELGRGSVSVAQAAVELARHVFSDLMSKTVLLVGAGQTAELAARSLIRNGVSHLIVANRTVSRARQLAEALLKGQPEEETEDVQDQTQCPAELEKKAIPCPVLQKQTVSEDSRLGPQQPALTVRALGLDDIPSVIAGVDLAICSIASQTPVLTYQGLKNVLSGGDRPLLIIDISVPRSVESRLEKLPNVFLNNIDDLNSIVAHNLRRRQTEIPRAEAIVQYQVQQFGKWLDSLEVAPTIKLLQRHFQQLQEVQVGRYGGKFRSSEREELEQFAKSLGGKILHGPLAFLKNLSAKSIDTETLAAVDAIRQMFDLDSLEQNE